MLSFKQFILEAPILDTSTENVKQPAEYGHVKNEGKRKTISTIGDNSVKELSLTPTTTSYTLHTPDNKIAIKAIGSRNGDKFTIRSLDSSIGSPIKAHQFYHHLITQNGVHLHSDNIQSPGGKKVWERLRSMPGIEMKSYHPDGSYRDIPDSAKLDDYFDSPVRFSAKKK